MTKFQEAPCHKPEITKTNHKFMYKRIFVFTLLRQGRLALTEKLLYRCTVGNTKEYAPVVKLSFGAKLVVPFAGLYKLLFYSLQYLMIAEGWVFMALVMCWPIKVIDIIIRIFLVTEARNFHKRIKRLFTTVSLY